MKTTAVPLNGEMATTNAALFDFWFPADELQIPIAVRPDIVGIVTGLRDQIDKTPPPVFVMVLTWLTYPSLETLPFYPGLEGSENPAIRKFIGTPGGLGTLDRTMISEVLSVFFKGVACEGGRKLPSSEMVAMLCREIYLSTIWGLPLAIPLTGIQLPSTFASDPSLYAKIHYPDIPPSWLVYDKAEKRIRAKDGKIDVLVIGSGPAGATMASELRAAGKRVVLIEQGPFVVWGSMNTMSFDKLMFNENAAATVDNGILVRSGQAMGGGSTVNIDLAFSPLEATIQYRVQQWKDDGCIDKDFYTDERVSAAYKWVRNAIQTRAVSQWELNRDNRVLWKGANGYGINPSLYHLNRFPQDYSPSPVTQKRDAARQLIVPAMEDRGNPLSVIPDAAVTTLTFATPEDGGDMRCTGAQLSFTNPWIDFGNTIVDPCRLGIAPGTTATIEAETVILSAGTIGSSHILLNTAKSAPAVANKNVGKGLIMHPSFPLIGCFDEKRINLLEGLDSASFVDSFGVTPGVIFETMSGLPAYGALLINGSGADVYKYITKFDKCAGFGVMLVDTPSDDNYVGIDADGAPYLSYALSADDKKRFAIGVGIAIRMMFEGGANEVIIPTNEEVLDTPDGLVFDPMVGFVLTSPDQADQVEKNIKFLPNRTLLTSAHLQASNKLGKHPDTSVASPRQRIWNIETNREIPNLYLMDSSMFPTSVGANPMQSLYTFAKIFADRLINGMDIVTPVPDVELASDDLPMGLSPHAVAQAAE